MDAHEPLIAAAAGNDDHVHGAAQVQAVVHAHPHPDNAAQAGAPARKLRRVPSHQRKNVDWEDPDVKTALLMEGTYGLCVRVQCTGGACEHSRRTWLTTEILNPQ